MKIRRFRPAPPPPEIEMTFNEDEGWAVLAALRSWAERNPYAHDVDKWNEWANKLDDELRQKRSAAQILDDRNARRYL